MYFLYSKTSPNQDRYILESKREFSVESHVPEREKNKRGWFGMSPESSKNPAPNARNLLSSFDFVAANDQYLGVGGEETKKGDKEIVGV